VLAGIAVVTAADTYSVVAGTDEGLVDSSNRGCRLVGTFQVDECYRIRSQLPSIGFDVPEGCSL